MTSSPGRAETSAGLQRLPTVSSMRRLGHAIRADDCRDKRGWWAGNSARHVPLARPDAVVVIADFHADRVPPAVLLPVGRIAQVVLLAQLVGHARRRRMQLTRVADDL